MCGSVRLRRGQWAFPLLVALCCLLAHSEAISAAALGPPARPPVPSTAHQQQMPKRAKHCCRLGLPRRATPRRLLQSLPSAPTAAALTTKYAAPAAAAAVAPAEAALASLATQQPVPAAGPRASLVTPSVAYAWPQEATQQLQSVAGPQLRPQLQAQPQLQGVLQQQQPPPLPPAMWSQQAPLPLAADQWAQAAALGAAALRSVSSILSALPPESASRPPAAAAATAPPAAGYPPPILAAEAAGGPGPGPGDGAAISYAAAGLPGGAPVTVSISTPVSVVNPIDVSNPISVREGGGRHPRPCTARSLRGPRSGGGASMGCSRAISQQPVRSDKQIRDQEQPSHRLQGGSAGAVPTTSRPSNPHRLRPITSPSLAANLGPAPQRRRQQLPRRHERCRCGTYCRRAAAAVRGRAYCAAGLSGRLARRSLAAAPERALHTCQMTHP
jgi:hypothetical protein